MQVADELLHRFRSCSAMSGASDSQKCFAVGLLKHVLLVVSRMSRDTSSTPVPDSLFEIYLHKV